jgi:hypothetical protein
MANPTCTFCGQREGVLMVITLSDGDTQVACGPCVPAFAIGMTASITTDMALAELELYASALDIIRDNDKRPPKPPEPAARKSRAKAKPAEVAPDGSETPLAVTVELDEPCPQCGGSEATGGDTKLTCNGCGAVLATVPVQAG